MITIPLYALLIIFFIYLAACSFFVFVNFGHLVNTASLGLFSYLLSMLVIAAIVIILWYTFLLLSHINWSQPLTIFNPEWFGGVFTINQSL